MIRKICLSVLREPCLVTQVRPILNTETLSVYSCELTILTDKKDIFKIIKLILDQLLE